MRLPVSISRRAFLSGAPKALAAISVLEQSLGSSAQQAPHNDARDLTALQSYFDVRSAYSPGELEHLYLGKKSSLYAAPAPGALPGVLFFFWDTATNQLINPYNLKVDSTTVKPGNYTLQSSIYNFHTSSQDATQYWNTGQNNVQLTFTAQAVDEFDEVFQWIVLSGVNIASDSMKGADKQSTLAQQNSLTSFSSPGDNVTIVNGELQLQLGLAVMKKESIWDHIIKAFGTVSDSGLLGLIPMPKLALDTVKAIGTMAAQLSQQHDLIPILKGKLLDFRLYDGSSSNPFLLKPGFWVVMNSTQAAPLMDSNHNIKKDIVLDIPGQQYDVVDTTDPNHPKPIDITYAVTNFKLSQVKSS
ncbi:hypothetical protein [Acidicapsa acidisoli]|uniref:hypothetical protein n=1 Tax=Acidicapsa acidisoli TaxID=1615681 RepID=UPI0021E06977|nr:hypothetical protein [Acidicapsa acidisoli]